MERDQVEPPGYKAVGKGERVLVEATPVIEGRSIVVAGPHLTESSGWVTLFELDRDGARRFDEAASRLYARSPRGRIVIVLDGEVRSAPWWRRPRFTVGARSVAGAEEVLENRDAIATLGTLHPEPGARSSTG